MDECVNEGGSNEDNLNRDPHLLLSSSTLIKYSELCQCISVSVIMYKEHIQYKLQGTEFFCVFRFFCEAPVLC